MKRIMDLNRIKLAVIFLACFVCLGFAGCDDEGEGLDYLIEYITDPLEVPENSVNLVTAGSDPEVLKLAIDLYYITNGDLHSVTFDLVYRSNIMEYVGYEVGSVLENAGQVSYQVGIDSGDPNRLVAAASVLGDGSISEAHGVVLYLKFKPRRLGICPFFFENGQLRNGNGPAGEPITGVMWYGGRATISK